MKLSQTYATTIHERESKLSARAVIIPARSFTDAHLLRETERLASELEFNLNRRIDFGQLTPVLASFFVEVPIERYNEDLSVLREYVSKEQLAFAEYLLSAQVIPFEHSPLGAESLGNLLGYGTGAGLGAAIAIVVTGAATPLLFVTVPAGMILFGAASGIAIGLEKGLSHRLRKLIGGE